MHPSLAPLTVDDQAFVATLWDRALVAGAPGAGLGEALLTGAAQLTHEFGRAPSRRRLEIQMTLSRLDAIAEQLYGPGQTVSEVVAEVILEAHALRHLPSHGGRNPTPALARARFFGNLDATAGRIRLRREDGSLDETPAVMAQALYAVRTAAHAAPDATRPEVSFGGSAFGTALRAYWDGAAVPAVEQALDPAVIAEEQARVQAHEADPEGGLERYAQSLRDSLRAMALTPRRPGASSTIEATTILTLAYRTLLADQAAQRQGLEALRTARRQRELAGRSAR